MVIFEEIRFHFDIKWGCCNFFPQKAKKALILLIMIDLY